MLVAREALTLVEDMVAEFRQLGRDAVPVPSVRAHYVAILTLLRAIGHILEKTDCVDAKDRQRLHASWQLWKQEKIFTTFIEPARNELLKEFKGGLRLTDREHVSSVFYATARGTTTAVNFSPDRLVDLMGRPIIPLFLEAIEFWRKNLEEVESFPRNLTKESQ